MPLIKPWKTVVLVPEYAGQWVVAADVDTDGEVEIVSAENVNVGDVHYTSTAVAQKLDVLLEQLRDVEAYVGTLLWPSERKRCTAMPLRRVAAPADRVV